MNGRQVSHLRNLTLTQSLAIAIVYIVDVQT